MIGIEEAIERGKLAGSMLYNRKGNCPDARRDQELRNLYLLAATSAASGQSTRSRRA